MAEGEAARAVREIKRSLLADGGLSDARLLEHFIADRDEAAFEALVRRHGPMVLGVCRRVAGHAQDAEDAFQAAFLVLARKATTVRPRDRVGNWLHGVAYRVARKVRVGSARRRSREAPVADVPEPAESHWDGESVIDEELAKLPDHYREPVLLCDLRGMGRKEVAEQLGIPEGTLSSRLTVARRKLADRLARRGVAVPAAGVVFTNVAVAQPLIEQVVTNAFAGASVAPHVAELAGRSTPPAVTGKLVAALALAAGAAVVFRGKVEPPPPSVPVTEVRPAAPAPVERPAAQAGLRRQLESTEWHVSQVDPTRRSISLADIRDPRAVNAVVIVAEPGGAALSGFTLGGLRVAPDAVVTIDGKASTFETLRPGMRVAVRLDATKLTAARVEATTPTPPTLAYELTAADPARRTVSVRVRETGVTMADLPLAADAEIRVLIRSEVQVLHFRSGTVADLKPGMRLSLELAASEDGTAVVRRVTTAE